MGEGNVARVRTIFEGFSAETVDEIFENYDPQFVYHPRSDEPDASVKANRDEFEQLVRGWLETFPQITFDVYELIEVGHYVVAVTALHGRGNTSGLEVEDDFVFVYKMLGEVAVEGWAYRTKDEALAAIAARSG